MFNVTTRNDKIYDRIQGKEVTKKVFMIRGDESYAKSTDILLTYNLVETAEPSVKGFKVNLSVDLFRTVGTGTVIIYDNDEILEMRTVYGNNGFSLNNVYLSYMVDHNLYAVYKGNSQCLSSKSKTINLNQDLPWDLTTDIVFSQSKYNMDENGSVEITMNATVNGEPVDDDTPILVYVDSVLNDSVTTTNGVASIILSGYSKGLHTINATIESEGHLVGSSVESPLSVGYDLSFTSIPQVFINNGNNTVRVKVSDYHNQVVNNANVSFAGLLATTDADGIATFTVTNINHDTVYSAISGGSSISQRLDAFTPSSLILSSDDGVTANNINERIRIIINGTGYTGYIPVQLTSGLNKTVQLLTNRPSSQTYTGTGAGDVTITAKCGNITSNIIIEDLKMGYKPHYYKYNLNYSVGNNGTVTEETNGLLFTINGVNNQSSVTFNSQTPRSVEFTVVDFASNRFYFLLNNCSYIFPDLAVGDKIKIVVNGNNIRYYRNNVLASSTSYDENSSFAIMGMNLSSDVSVGQSNSSTNYLKITDFKIK